MSTICHACSGFKPDKTLLISILYIKNTNKAVCSRVLISILYIKNTINMAVYLSEFVVVFEVRARGFKV
jgi:hypothetical protein